jgi:hypothetical protein
MVVPAGVIAVFHCDDLAALVAKTRGALLFNLLSSARHAIVTQTPTLAGV